MNRRDRANLALLAVLAAVTAANITAALITGSWIAATGGTAGLALGSISAVYLSRKHKEQQ